MEDFRTESDTMGEIKVPSNQYWGAQTQRSLQNFEIGKECMPEEVITALVMIKKAAAIVNMKHKKIPHNIGNAIINSCDTILANFENYISNFPLTIWQTGSGTQTNMNVNEVIAGMANESLTGHRGGKEPVHPNNHVNYAQSSNDTFPTAMHVASSLVIYHRLMPALLKMIRVLEGKVDEMQDIVKIGRTHTQDATPITLGQEFGGYKAQLTSNICNIYLATENLLSLAQGGTAVGTGINCYAGFAQEIAHHLSDITEIKKLIHDFEQQGHSYLECSKATAKLCLSKQGFITHPNKFAAMAAHDELVQASATLNTLAVSLMKIANDIRFLASGPRCGLGELLLPENEPGSSIMPGKVNPTQCEAITMICTQVMGNHVTITLAGSNGHFELNVFKPVIIRNFIHSGTLLADAVESFTDKCLADIKPNIDRISDMVQQSLMLVTALNPYIGYDNAAQIAKKAHKEHKSLLQAGIDMGLCTAEQYHIWVDVKKMATEVK